MYYPSVSKAYELYREFEGGVEQSSDRSISEGLLTDWLKSRRRQDSPNSEIEILRFDVCFHWPMLEDY